MYYQQRMSNPETGAMFDRSAQLVRETIEIPNHLLPERYRDGRLKHSGQSLEEIEQKIRDESQTRHQQEVCERSKRVEEYRRQWEANPDQPLQYFERLF